MSTDRLQKITTDHLRRDAFLYVRQSSLRQVMENTESTKRQYALRDRAIALGWPIERVHVIDSDLGLSGAHAQDRDGFQHLVSEVANGHAGIVIGLEVSRLARNNADWHRLIELSALSQTLILDEDGIYDPAHFNDRLLLGLKGAMSEAELHVLKARLQGGIRNKARRGELEIPLPIGLTYHPGGSVVLDPDAAIRAAIQLVFDTFRHTHSATATVKRFRREGWLFPRRIRRGIGKGEVMWGAMEHCRVIQVLHNPRYAGAFVYGRTRGAYRPREQAYGRHRSAGGLASPDPRCPCRLYRLGGLRAQSDDLEAECRRVWSIPKRQCPTGRGWPSARSGRMRYLRGSHAGTVPRGGGEVGALLYLHRERGAACRQTLSVHSFVAARSMT